METVSCNCPTIMKRPNYRNTCRIQIFKKQTVIEIMIMNIMQLNNIRLYFLDFFNQSTCCLLRTQSFIIKNSLLSIMGIHIPLGTYLYKFAIRWIHISSIGNITLPSVSHCPSTYFLCDTTISAPISCYVNLKKYFFHKHELLYFLPFLRARQEVFYMAYWPEYFIMSSIDDTIIKREISFVIRLRKYILIMLTSYIYRFIVSMSQFSIWKSKIITRFTCSMMPLQVFI